MAMLELGEKSLVVAMDHGQSLGAVSGLEDPGRLLDRVIDAGADGIMTSYGIVKRYRDVVAGGNHRG
jgi:class I fructose-bisphosphate aldolase